MDKMSNNYSDQIEKYLDGELSAEEAKAFEQALEQDVDLKEEFDFYQMANEAIVSNKLLDIEELAKNAGNTHAKKVKKKKNLIKGIAGGLVLLTLGAVAVEGLKEDVQVIEAKKETSNPITPVEKNISDQSDNKAHNELAKQPESNNTTSKSVIDESVVEEELKQTDGSLENVESIEQKDENIDKANTSGTATKEKGLCDDVNITSTFDVIATCTGKAAGGIILKEVTGGTKPYSFILSDGQENTSGTFNGLAKGTYSVYIADANACGAMVDQLVVSSKSCKIDLYFDPASGNGAIFPAYHQTGQLTIVDKKGQEQQKMSIAADQQLVWKNSLSLPAGYYLFNIEYEDGNTRNGSLTIMP